MLLRIPLEMLVLGVLAAALTTMPTAARAVEVDTANIQPACPKFFEFKSGKCAPQTTEIAKIDAAADCTAPSLKWQPDPADAKKNVCVAVADQVPEPSCGKNLPNVKFKGGKCVLSTTPEDDAKGDFFRDWAVGIALIRPKMPTVVDAAIVNKKVRVNSEFRHESALLVARHFYPWNPGRRCVQGGQFADADKAKPDAIDGMLGFVSNCVGLMIAAGMPTAGAPSGQIINFLGLGLAIGGGVPQNEKLNWHVGVGVGRKLNMRVLGDGWVDGADAPAGEEQIRYKTIDASARFVYFTVRW